MKKILMAGLTAGLLMLGVAGMAEAALVDYGPDSLGNKLIYDTDLDITWYDYTKSSDRWYDQVAWADNLSVTHNGVTYTDWRLPATVDGTYVYGCDGTTTGGYNITTSEMGHLYYTELGNKGYADTSGSHPQPGWGLSNTGPFQNLILANYWSGTEYTSDPGNAWFFRLYNGLQSYYSKGNSLNGLAVRNGQVSAVPIPGAIWLLGSSLLVLTGINRRRKI